MVVAFIGGRPVPVPIGAEVVALPAGNEKLEELEEVVTCAVGAQEDEVVPLNAYEKLMLPPDAVGWGKRVDEPVPMGKGGSSPLEADQVEGPVPMGYGGRTPLLEDEMTEDEPLPMGNLEVLEEPVLIG